MVEGNEVKMRSSIRLPGNGVTFLFSGTATPDAITGSVYLGEYLNAKFTARRAAYLGEKRRITIPGGPPLAT